jgi:hypothetical protein
MAKIKSTLDEFAMADCNATHSPYRSGLVIDCIPKDSLNPEEKPHIVKPYQHHVGGLNWLYLCMQPELCIPVSLPSSHLHNPSISHFNAAKQVLAWLSRSRNYGIRSTQGGSFAAGLVSWVDKEDADCTLHSTVSNLDRCQLGSSGRIPSKAWHNSIHHPQRSPFPAKPLCH